MHPKLSLGESPFGGDSPRDNYATTFAHMRQFGMHPAYQHNTDTNQKIPELNI